MAAESEMQADKASPSLGAEAGSPDEAPRRRRMRRYKAPEVSPALGADAGSPGDQEAPKRRRIRRLKSDEGTRCKVVTEEADPERTSPAGNSPRFRVRGGAQAAGGRKRARTRGEESGDEEEPDDESISAWERLLAARATSDDRRLAFALQPMVPQELRQLGPESYLGKRKEPGAQPLFNREGKVSLQYLLANYKTSERRREEAAPNPHRPFLRWLVKQARELRLLSSRELRRGTIDKPRLEEAKNNGYSLADKANLAQASDDEGRGHRKDESEKLLQGKSRDALLREPMFPERQKSVAEDADAKEVLMKHLRSQVERTKEKVQAQSSHGRDLKSMSSLLSAPSLSFDWGEPDSDEDGNPNGILQVELPASAQRPEARRALLREHIQRSMSFKQAEALTSKAHRTLSATSVSSGTSPKLGEVAKEVNAKKPRTGSAPTDEDLEPVAKVPKEPPAAADTDVAMNTLAKEGLSGLGESLPQSAGSIDAKVPSPGETSTDISPAAEGPASAEISKHQADRDSVPEAAANEPTEPPAEGHAVSEDVEVHHVAPDCEGPSDVEISPTLPFEVVVDEPQGKAEVPSEDAGITATLPFDVVLEAETEEAKTEVRTAVGEERHSEAQTSARATLEAKKEATAAWTATQETPSSEDDEDEDESELTAGQRRERAWLQHMRKQRRQEERERQQKQKTASGKVGRVKAPKPQEEDDLFLTSRQNRRQTGKTSILMMGIAGMGA